MKNTLNGRFSIFDILLLADIRYLAILFPKNDIVILLNLRFRFSELRQYMERELREIFTYYYVLLHLTFNLLNSNLNILLNPCHNNRLLNGHRLSLRFLGG
jgi:hypothetical protein